ncbi:MAG: hypothetical protein FWF22_04070 [Treponema sp.]|nr:hypothetical protein [Treponema sp.]
MIKTVSLSGNFRDARQADEFFSLSPSPGFDRFVLMAPDWNRGPANPYLRGQIADGSITSFKSYIFGEKTVPALENFIDKNEVEIQRSIADAVYRNCLQKKIKFVFNLVLPKFPFNEKSAVQNALPCLYKSDGRMNLSASEHIPLIVSMMDEVYSRYPKMAGFEIWIAEGAGATVHQFDFEDLQSVDNWLDGWLEAVSGYGKKYNLEMAVFSHHYHHSRETLWNNQVVIQKHPDLMVMVDNTWPEENVALSSFKYLDDFQFAEIFRKNPVSVNYLLDTEYMGQGRIPSVYPAFWQKCLQKAEQMNAECANGRIFYWDDYATMDSWNIVNVYLFCRLARDPYADVSSILKDILSEKFGSFAAAETLKNFLNESQKLSMLTQTLNGISFPDHSAFPQPAYLNREYFKNPFLAMKAVDDLFSTPGTHLAKPADGNLRAGSQWRTQLNLIAREPSGYFGDIETGITGIEKLLRETMKLKNDLPGKDFSFISQSYDLWLFYAKANRLFIIAASHHCAVRSGRSDKNESTELLKICNEMEKLAGEFLMKYNDSTLFNLAGRLKAMADFIKTGMPHD